MRGHHEIEDDYGQEDGKPVCGAALRVWLLSVTYGLDLSAGFFQPISI